MTDQNTNPKTNAAFVGALLTIFANTAATITYTEPHIKIISPYNCDILFFRQYLNSRELSGRLTDPEAIFL